MNTDTFKDRRNVTDTETTVSPHSDTNTKRDTTTGGARENSYTTNTTDAFQHGMTHTPELKQTTTGIPVLRFSIAVDRSVADSNGERQTETSFMSESQAMR